MNLIGCVADEDVCTIQTEDVPLGAFGLSEGDAQLSNTPPLLFVLDARVFWTLPSDSVEVALETALPDYASPTTVTVLISELDLQDTESDSTEYVSETQHELLPDKVVELYFPLSSDVRPKALHLDYPGPDAMYIYRVRVQRKLCL